MTKHPDTPNSDGFGNKDGDAAVRERTMTTRSSAMLPHAPATPAPMLDESFGLALMDGEKVLVEGEPMRDRLMSYFLWASVVVALFTAGIGLAALPLVYLIGRAFVGKHNYWLTSSRVVVTNGIIGYKARSIPLERVSDVAISCNWLERALGLRSVIVRDMTGEAVSGAAMLGVADATTLQRRILDEVHAVNRRESNQDNDRSRAQPYRSPESANEMLEILRRIERNTREG